MVNEVNFDISIEENLELFKKFVLNKRISDRRSENLKKAMAGADITHVQGFADDLGSIVKTKAQAHFLIKLVKRMLSLMGLTLNAQKS